MRLLLSLIGIALLAFTAGAQEPALPTNSPTPAGEATPAETATPPPLIPAAPIAPVLPSAPPTPDLSQLDAAFKKTPMGKAADDYRLHVEWRELQNRLAADPELNAQKKAANAARTDLEKRNRLRAYYEHYYTRMRAMAATPELQAFVETQKTAHLGMTAQNSVRPSPLPTASPRASPAH